jgi:hypothetical protein
VTSTGTLGVELAAQSPETAGYMVEWDDCRYGHVHCPLEGYRDQAICFAKLIDMQ